jgi:hypothetical protein
MWSADPNSTKKVKTTAETPKDEGVVFRGWGAPTPEAEAPKETPAEEDGVVFRGWGDSGKTPKTPEQPKRKNWFWK